MTLALWRHYDSCERLVMSGVRDYSIFNTGLT